MLAEINTVCFQGMQAVPVIVQVQIAGGSLPSFSIVGLADKAVSESRDRIRGALHTLGIGLPPKRITMNLSPANIQKEGTHYDLPMALGLLVAMGIIPEASLDKSLSLGELGLDGSLKFVSGVLAAALCAAHTENRLICPESCGSEAAWGGDIEILAPQNLIQLINHFKGNQMLSAPVGQLESLAEHNVDFADVHGQEQVKRALLIAAAGRLNILMSGPPGAGKSLLAARLPSIMPLLEPQEALETTMIHSLAGQKTAGLMRMRPFRNPHHSVSVPALVGGGLKGLPGEISLAHRGILFLDELPEFSRTALESLRQSMESHQAVVARANYRHVYPAEFQLIAAMNPCPCGYASDINRQCNKAPLCVYAYQHRLSFPLLDRIDLFIDVPALSLESMVNASKATPSAILRTQVEQAWRFQKNQGFSEYPLPAELDNNIQEESEAKAMLIKAATKWSFSARSYYRILRVARTIASLEHSVVIQRSHIAEALSYRPRQGTR